MDGNPRNIRHLKVEDIRKELSDLNKVIRQLSAEYKGNRKSFILLSSAGAIGAAGATIVFPPGLLLFAVFTGAAMGDRGSKMVQIGHVLEEAIRQREALKILYRARPGRKQFNLAARRAREDARYKKNPRNHYYGGP